MNQPTIVQNLSSEAANNPAWNAVAHVFAMRHRTRHQITVHSLAQKMKQEGFNYKAAEYEKILKFLSTLGFGRLESDPKGRVKALKDINITLQSIGAIACGAKSTFVRTKERNKFKALTPVPPVESSISLGKLVSVVFSINSKPVTVSIPENLTGEEITLLINKFQDKK